MTDADLTGPDPDVAAAELALGLLEGEERAAALRRMLSDPAFARDVERWRMQFGALFAGVPAVVPTPDVGERVIARLDNPGATRPGYWKPFAIASSLAAASLLGLLMVRPQPTLPPAPVIAAAPAPAPAAAPMVAAFMVEGIEAPIVATYDSTHGRLSMPGPMPVPAGKSAQLWAIVEGDDAPHPLGLFHAAGDRVEAEARSAAPMEPGTKFAISFEPLGGSPTGLPTGPVVANATLSRV